MSFTHAVSFIFSHMITKHKKVISAMYTAADFYFSIHGSTKFSQIMHIPTFTLTFYSHEKKSKKDAGAIICRMKSFG